MKKFLFLFVALLPTMLFAGVQGALSGQFSVSATKKVYFSQGNLQYQASTNTFRFASAQYTRIGVSGNNNVSATYTGWIDWYGWGTGNNPTKKTEVSSEYSSFTDWGVNAISNGGNQANLWRTLTKAEWEYLFSGRANAASRRSMATVNDVKGYIFLPDSWSLPSGISFTADVQNSWTKNKYTSAQWQLMEQNGAVFLPKTASISENSSGPDNYYDTGWNGDDHCNYWSSTQASSVNAYVFQCFLSDYYISSHGVSVDGSKKYHRQGVRLVLDSDKNTTYTITTSASNGNVTGGGEYVNGASAQLTAIANECYEFVQWSDGNTDTPRTVTVTGDATYTAEFEKSTYTVKGEDSTGGKVKVEE